MKYYALALCGGGAKGAFHIGMWKALINLHYIDKIKSVSGTSVGALNAVLFSLGDYEKAKTLWNSLKPDMFLSPNEKSTDAFFSRDGLIHIIDKLNLSNLKIDVYINIYNTKTQQTENYKLNEYSNARKRDLLLASSALPIAYDKVTINNIPYHDGGVIRSGNVPVEPLYKNGYRDIIIASLDHNFNPYHLYDSILVKDPLKAVNLYDRYPNCNFKNIIPLESMGNILTGTLNFSSLQIRNKMIQGYKDTIKQLKNEDVYIMNNNYSKINIQIRNKMEQLFKSSEEIENFIKVTNFSEANLPTATFGGVIWYENIVDLYGWKIQQHKLLGLQSHYRILDRNNVRRAWVLDPMDIIHALDDYEATNAIDTPVRFR